jgi:hypothetical protein
VAHLHQQSFSQLRSYVFPQRYYSVNFVIHRKIRETQNTSFLAHIFSYDVHNELRTQKHVPLYLSVNYYGCTLTETETWLKTLTIYLQKCIKIVPCVKTDGDAIVPKINEISEGVKVGL